MRIVLVVVAGVALAACEPAKPNVAPTSPSPSEPVTAAPAPVVTAAPADMQSIPAAYLGKWDATAEACAQPSIDTLTIAANELRFHESIGEINSITQDGDGIVVAGPFEGEGESWDGSMRLALSADQNTLTLTNNGKPVTRVRCP